MEIASVFEYFKAMLIKIFVLKLPQNESEVKDVVVKDILRGKIIEYNLIRAVSKDIIKSFDAAGW